MDGKDFKAYMFEQFATVAQAFSAPKRLELLDVLAQGERDVESLSRLTSMTVANTSRHLQLLKQARFVESRREGSRRVYSLADDEVLRCVGSLRVLAEKRSAELRRVAVEYYEARDAMEAITKEELWERMERGEVIVLDVRPREEYEQGHIKDAISIPFAELSGRFSELPEGRQIVAYCRGPYCVLSVEAMGLLRARGVNALRLDEGLPEWKIAGLPIGGIG